MTRFINVIRSIVPLAAGAVLGGGGVLAAADSPKEHVGLTVETLGRHSCSLDENNDRS